MRVNNLKYLLLCVVVAFMTVACKNESNRQDRANKLNWNERNAAAIITDSLETGSSYLSVYSQIYSGSQERLVDLTATISMRNPNTNDTLFVNNINYYNTNGEQIRSYLQEPIFILPMETLEILIEHRDNEGGTGANIIFNWSKTSAASDPVFEAVMISTYGQMGLSFLTHGIRVD